MRIGFIGAGKVGCSLGHYFAGNNIGITGYYSRTWESARQGATLTNSVAYDNMRDLVRDSDVIFVTAPDQAVAAVWQQLRQFSIRDKIISHCSGALSSAVFSDISDFPAYGYSIHPFIPISARQSDEELRDALFTLEGSPDRLKDMERLVASCGNQVVTVSPECKIRYHGAAVMASNLYVGLVSLCQQMLTSCGFSPDQAQRALSGLILENAEHMVNEGVTEALTGPIERGDAGTVAAHLKALTDEERAIYRALSVQVVKVAREKHPTRDYREIEELLKTDHSESD